MEYAVKSCGNAHAWCKVCRPEQAAAQRTPKRPPKEHTRPCRDCGRCDDCLGLVAPDGMKVCRGCGETKPVGMFGRRADTGGLRNQCRSCKSAQAKYGRCVDCGVWFHPSGTDAERCTKCRGEVTKTCKACGVTFKPSMELRRYCSEECREAAHKTQRAEARKAQRAEALAEYSGPAGPACACCGETNETFLALDHVVGGGAAHRRETGGGGFYTWLKKNDYPQGFQILCHNCNLGRQLNGGVCPHKE